MSDIRMIIGYRSRLFSNPLYATFRVLLRLYEAQGDDYNAANELISEQSGSASRRPVTNCELIAHEIGC